jgi:hypothetical protein
MDKLGVVLVHDLLLDNGVVLGLLRESRREEKHLPGKNHLHHDGVEYSHTRLGIQRRQREGEEVGQHVSRAEQTN